MASLKNWDNKTWLSSRKYIETFNDFITKNIKLTKNSKILDIGCGIGNIIGNLYSKLKLIKKPIGLDIENHKDRNKNIILKKIDAIKFITKTNITFDLILIKQTIHLLKKNQILKLILVCKKKLNSKGKIIILSLDPKKNEIPSFSLMHTRLKKSLNRDKRIFNIITKNYPKIIKKNHTYKVNISKRKYIKMIKSRYISTLLSLSDKQIDIGINEINSKYKSYIKFKDRLICLILKK